MLVGKQQSGKVLLCSRAAHLVGEELLVDLAMVHLLLDGATCDQPVDDDLLLLTDTPSSLPGLHVCGRVPVWVVDQDPA